MAVIGYIRVSTDEQNTGRQEAALQGCDKLFVEKVSGKDTAHRKQLAAMMNYVREGDTVKVESYSRFARSTKDLLNLIEALEKKGVHFISLKEQIDTSTLQGRLMLTIFAGLAQFEREQMLQRQKEGIALAKAKGKYKGRKRIEADTGAFESQYRTWKDGKQTARATMQALGMKPNTFYRRVKEYEAGGK